MEALNHSSEDKSSETLINLATEIQARFTFIKQYLTIDCPECRQEVSVGDFGGKQIAYLCNTCGFEFTMEFV